MANSCCSVYGTVQAQIVEVAQKVDRAVARAQLQRALSEATIALAALEDNSET